ncbi:MAG TPA: MaoC family dehydratase [Chloroflexota bacterium]|nr:MaoC family dehydratase [Chloroflexota bacterium]
MPDTVPPPVAGETLGPLTVPITAERVRAYAEASGDFNPVHIDPEFAATTEFGGPIAHGMLLLAYVARVLDARFGRAWPATGALDARFRAPALVGTTVTIQCAIQAVVPDGEGQRVECRITCIGAQGESLVTATASLRLAAAVHGNESSDV